MSLVLSGMFLVLDASAAGNEEGILSACVQSEYVLFQGEKIYLTRDSDGESGTLARCTETSDHSMFFVSCEDESVELILDQMTFQMRTHTCDGRHLRSIIGSKGSITVSELRQYVQRPLRDEAIVDRPVNRGGSSSAQGEF